MEAHQDKVGNLIILLTKLFVKIASMILLHFTDVLSKQGSRDDHSKLNYYVHFGEFGN